MKGERTSLGRCWWGAGPFHREGGCWPLGPETPLSPLFCGTSAPCLHQVWMNVTEDKKGCVSRAHPPSPSVLPAEAGRQKEVGGRPSPGPAAVLTWGPGCAGPAAGLTRGGSRSHAPRDIVVSSSFPLDFQGSSGDQVVVTRGHRGPSLLLTWVRLLKWWPCGPRWAFCGSPFLASGHGLDGWWVC